MKDKKEEEEKKNGFVFYESWYDGAKYLKGKHRLSYLEAIINYGLFGEEIETKGVENALFCAIKPTIKFNRKQKSNGQQGGGTEGNNNASKTTQKRPKNDPNSSIYINDSDKYIDGEIDFDKEPPKGGESVISAPASEDFLETFGLLNNVHLAAEQHRHLVEDYGQEATDATIDDLSCKLADGTVDSSNHYATLLSWLRYQRRNGGTATMSSTQAVPTYTPPQQEERKLTTDELDVIAEWQDFTTQYREDKEKYAKLNEIAQRHGGIATDVLPKLGMMQWKDKWIFK